MNRTISLRVQRIISFIPFVNASVLFMWLYNYRSAVNDSKVFAKSLLVIFATTLPLALLQMMFQQLLESQGNMINLLAVYLIPLSMASGLIHFQKNILK